MKKTIKTSLGRGEEARINHTEIELPDTIAQNVAQFNEVVVMSNYLVGVRLDVQGSVRNLMRLGKTDDEIKIAMTGYKPTETKRGKTDFEKAQTQINKMSEAQLTALEKVLAAKIAVMKQGSSAPAQSVPGQKRA